MQGGRYMADKEKILILSANEDNLNGLSEIVSGASGELGYGGVSVGKDSSVKQKFSADTPCEYGLVIISAPLEDEYGLSLAAHISAESDAAVILLAAQKNADAAFKRLENTGVIVLPKPVNPPLLTMTLKYMTAERKRRREAEEKAAALKKKLNEIMIIDRAKCVLIQYLRLSEPEAHRHIQKQAMDLREPLIKVATDILKAYEYL